jgi:hypothetical protein
MLWTLLTRSSNMVPRFGPKVGVSSVLMPCGSQAAHDDFCCVSGAARATDASSASAESSRAVIVQKDRVRWVERGERCRRLALHGGIDLVRRKRLTE